MNDRVSTLQATLTAQHAAVYLYGLFGARTSATDHPTLAATLRDGYVDHRRQRDALTALIHQAGQEPVAADLGYTPATPALTAKQVRRAARILEERLCPVYSELVEHSSGQNRALALDCLAGSAVRVVRLGGEPTPFPGLTAPPRV